MFLTAKEVYSGNLIIVNAAHPYHEEASKIRLRPVRREAPDILLEEHALLQLSGLMAEINGWEGIVPVSGWRSREEQEQLYSQSLRDNGRAFTEQFVAVPGHSEHQTGLAIDLGLAQEELDRIRPRFPYDGICGEFRRWAADFGFIERYPAGKEEITGIAHEPWHFRYVGAPHAAIMTELGLALEEYCQWVRQFAGADRAFQKGRYRIFYQQADGAAVLLPDSASCTVSGDNACGWIVTVS